MPRKLQPNQVVTYRKKIIYRMPENDSKNFFDTFLGIFLINILAISISVATAGVGGSVAAAIEVSQLSQAIISSSIQSLVNFSINTTFDALTNNINAQNLLLNALFSVTDVGKIGRGWREDKLIKILNQSELLEQIGFNDEIKNFIQLENFFQLKDVILKDKTKIAFSKTVSDSELLSSIFLVADAEMKKEIKKLSYDQLKSLVDIERLIYQINPKLIYQGKKPNIKALDKILMEELNINYDDFLRLDDVEAVNSLLKLQTTRVGAKTISNLNLVRMNSKFQRSVFGVLKDNWKNLKNTSRKLNPFYWLKKIEKEITKPIDEFIEVIAKKSAKYFEKIPKIGQKIIRENNLIPCQPQSFLLAFKFEPVTIDGSGYITIYKKPYVWKKAPKISNYNPVRVWTNMIEVERFVTAKSQNNFYNENWALGYGFRQGQLKQLMLLGPRVQRIVSQINRYYRQVNKFKLLIDSGLLAFAKTMNRRGTNVLNKRLNSHLAKLIGIIPLGTIFTSSIIKSVRSGKWNYSWIRNDVAKHIKRKTIRKTIGVVYGEQL